jgi:hypothetical protein
VLRPSDIAPRKETTAERSVTTVVQRRMNVTRAGSASDERPRLSGELVAGCQREQERKWIQRLLRGNGDEVAVQEISEHTKSRAMSCHPRTAFAPRVTTKTT